MFFPEQLRKAGFHIVIHDDHFGKRHQTILDPEVITECGRQGWFLLTADKDMPFRWAAEIINANLGVFCQTNNTQGPKLWAPRLVALKEQIIKKSRNVATPFVIQITADKKPKLIRRHLLQH